MHQNGTNLSQSKAIATFRGVELTTHKLIWKRQINLQIV